MATSHHVTEQIVAQATQLSFEERLRLAHRIIDTLRPTKKPGLPRHLVYGQFHGAQMSTDEDFALAEWRPTEAELNGD